MLQHSPQEVTLPGLAASPLADLLEHGDKASRSLSGAVAGMNSRDQALQQGIVAELVTFNASAQRLGCLCDAGLQLSVPADVQYHVGRAAADTMAAVHICQTLTMALVKQPAVHSTASVQLESAIAATQVRSCCAPHVSPVCYGHTTFAVTPLLHVLVLIRSCRPCML